jgi:hypothetical protein
MGNKRVDPSTLEVGDYVSVMSPVSDEGNYTWIFGTVTSSISDPNKPNLFMFALGEGTWIYDMDMDKTVSQHFVEETEPVPRFSSITTPYIMVFKNY